MTKYQPKLAVNTNNLHFDYQTNSQNIILTNLRQTDVVNWSLTSNKSWLTANSYSGSISTTEQKQLTINVDTSTLSYGIQTGNLSFSSNGGDTIIIVTIDFPKLDSSWLDSISDSIIFDEYYITWNSFFLY